jgi:hypothetical protein
VEKCSRLLKRFGTVLFLEDIVKMTIRLAVEQGVENALELKSMKGTGKKY